MSRLEKSLDDFTEIMKELSGLIKEVKLDNSVLYNEDIHHNLLAEGYSYEGRNSEFSESYDEYEHPDCDDWLAIYSDGRVEFLDICEYTEGSVTGRAVKEQWINRRNRVLEH
jgi:hypothetical protein